MLQHLVARSPSTEEVEQLARRFAATTKAWTTPRAIAQMRDRGRAALARFASTVPGRELKQARAVHVERSSSWSWRARGCAASSTS
jgi:hypothetical protein